MEIEQLYEIYKSHPVITTDSRDCPEGSIFIALKGDTFNGNKFAKSALEKGCAYAVVDEPGEHYGDHKPTAAIIVRKCKCDKGRYAVYAMGGLHLISA